MKKTLNEEKIRFRQIVEQFEEQNRRQPKRQYASGEMELDTHVYCPLNLFYLSVSQKPINDDELLKDDITFIIKGNSNAGDLKIASMDVNGDYTDEQIQRAKQLVEEAIRTANIPSGCSFDILDPKDSGSMEF